MPRNVVTIILTVLLALAFLGAGLAKLTHQQMMVEEFASFGYPIWFMYVTGVIELLGAALLCVPRYAFVGCGILLCVMIGALVTHLTHGQFAKLPPVIVLAALLLTLGWLRNWGGIGPFARTGAGA